MHKVARLRITKQEAEWLTRKQRIDTKLRALNPSWQIVPKRNTLSTGADIPTLEFIVFLRPVKSRTLWVQMLGRGTRISPEINKTKFTVFDCFDATLLEYFKNTTDFEIQPPTKTPLTIPQVIENIWQNVDRDYHVRILAKRLRRIEKGLGNRSLKTMCRAGFAMANSMRNWHSCQVNITEDVRKYAAEQGISEEEALEQDLEAKSKEFVEKGAEVYSRA